VSRTRYARSDDSRIAYELRGTRRWRRPWLVLIQGMGFDRQGWEPVLRNLRRHFRLVLVDNRGSGRSDLPPGSFGVADMAGDILTVLDGAGIRRAHVMGVSLGGMVAQELAVDHPERVGDLILVSTTPGWPFAYPMPAASAALIARTGSLTREVTARCHTENALSAGYSGRLRQTRIRARALVLHGSADTVVDPGNSKLLADRIPGAQLVIFPELGHLLFWEEPDRFVDAVTQFLLAERAPRKVLHSGDGKH
jgi:pimeloyl-ACP methyl ester carboxylesterase